MACTAKLKESGQKAAPEAPEAPEVRSLPLACATVRPESGAIKSPILSHSFPLISSDQYLTFCLVMMVSMRGSWVMLHRLCSFLCMAMDWPSMFNSKLTPRSPEAKKGGKATKGKGKGPAGPAPVKGKSKGKEVGTTAEHPRVVASARLGDRSRPRLHRHGRSRRYLRNGCLASPWL